MGISLIGYFANRQYPSFVCHRNGTVLCRSFNIEYRHYFLNTFFDLSAPSPSLSTTTSPDLSSFVTVVYGPVITTSPFFKPEVTSMFLSSCIPVVITRIFAL